MALQTRSSSALTHTLASLATSSTRVAGQASAAYDNSTNKDENLAVSLMFTTGTSPTASFAEAWLVQEREDGTWPDIFTSTYSGSDGAFTVKSRDILRAGAVLLGSTATDSTSNRTYVFQLRDAPMLFGTKFVNKFFVWFTHSTAVNLNSTSGNHETIVKPSYWS